MSTSLRNSIHRRNHKERSQLSHRSKLGLLEKHRDYVKRARDYHTKQDRLTRLKQKVAEKNKDEFYFGMNSERTQGGVHVQDRGNSALPVDIVKVLKSQDENYVRTMRAAGLKKIDKIKTQLMTLADLVKPGSFDHGAELKESEQFLDDDEIEILRKAGVIPRPTKGKRSKKSKHVIFVDNEEQARQYATSKRKSLDNDVDMPGPSELPKSVDLGWKIAEGNQLKKSKPTASTSQTMLTAENDIARAQNDQLASRHRTKLLKELSARLWRDTQMRYAEREFELQRALMGKGGRQKLKGVERIEQEGDVDSEEDQDEIDARKGKKKPGKNRVDEATYKPRVYKWKLERK